MSQVDRGRENLEKRFFLGTGKYEIPPVKPCHSYTAQKFVSFNHAKTEKNRLHKGLHCYTDDYQFERLWETPSKYVDLLCSYDAVLSPDFSLYADYPLAMQIYNHYRKMWLSAYYQEYGVNIIPVACWSDDRSFEFCFDGMPVDSIISVANTGAVHGTVQQELFKQGYEKMMELLHPREVLFFGQKQDFMDCFDVPVTPIGESHERFAHLDTSTYSNELSADELDEFEEFLNSVD